MNEKSLLLKNKVEKFKLNLTEIQLSKFEIFNNFLQEYNKHTNLVSANDINLIYEKHLPDSLAFHHYIKNDKSYKIIDIGSGGGFPVIPLAVVLTKSKIFALDSTKKKTDFIMLAAKEMNLNNLEIINERAESTSHRKSFREKFDIVTARAVGNLAQISELCIPFLNISGKFIAYKSSKVNEEIDNAKNAITALGAEIKSIYEYNIEYNDNLKRNLVLIEKLKSTPTIYPRSYSNIKNNPINF